MNKFLVLFLALFSFTAFANESKYALIIGNDNYVGDFSPLPTCVNDAVEMDKCMQALGYKTILLRDASRKEILEAIERFESMIRKKASVGVFFYSGHAVTIDTEPYLIPAKDSINKNNGRLKEYCVGLDAIRSLMKGKCNKSILFMDACRDIVVDDTKGGAWVPPSPKPDNSQQIVCWATGLGDVARPGKERLSPFTQVVTSHLFDAESFQEIWALYIEKEVLALSDKSPVWEGIFSHPFYFNPGGAVKSITRLDSANKREITINVSPDMAKIKIGDKEYSSGQALLYSIGSTYTYTIHKEGYEPYSGVLKVTSSSPSTVDVVLKKVEKASIRILCKQNADVYVDNEYIGVTPCTVNTTSGEHRLRIVKDGYESLVTGLNLHPGENKAYTTYLTRDIGLYWEAPDYDGAHHINYHFSPKYQLGFSYMYRLEYSQFSYGLTLAASPGWFKGLNVISSSVYVGTEIRTTIDKEIDGVITPCEVVTTYSGGTDEKYSAEVDPYNEAKYYEANSLLLANVGYHITNGVMIEAGVGVGYHQDRYYMETTYDYTKTVTTNLITGEIVGSPEYKYTANNMSHLYRDSSKWSPAIRLGAKFFIPLDDFDDYSLTVGGGYTVLPTNMECSSWDATVGFCWYF